MTDPRSGRSLTRRSAAVRSATWRGAKSPREAQTVRDRYLGRKNSVVASWMQLSRPLRADEKKHIGRVANELKQAIESRWAAFAAAAEGSPRPLTRSTSRCLAACRCSATAIR